MLTPIFRTGLSLLILISAFQMSLSAYAGDRDGDGVEDIQDAYPDDASRQYLPIAEAISKVEDQNLRSCIDNQHNFRETAGEVFDVECRHTGVASLSGIENFSELERLWLDDSNLRDISPIAKLVDLNTFDISWGSRGITDISALAELEKLQRLDTEGQPIADFSPLATLSQIEYLQISHSRLSDLTQLGDKPSLTHLQINDSLVREIADLAFAPKLETLYAWNLQLKALPSLEGLSSLRNLHLSSNQLTQIELPSGADLDQLDLRHNQDLIQITGLEAVARVGRFDIYDTGLTDLNDIPENLNVEHLNVGGHQLKDIQQLSVLDSLNSLGIHWAPLLTNFSVIADIDSLRHLELRGLEQLTDLNFLQSQDRLGSLSLMESRNVDDFSGLAFLFDASDIRLNYLGNLDLAPLSDLDNLTQLELRGNDLTDISDLEFLRYLENLYLDNNRIQDITVLRRIRTLRGLSLSNNEVKSLDPVSDLDNLSWLNAQNNLISDISPLSSVSDLSDIRLEDNEITRLVGVFDTNTASANVYLNNNPILCAEIDEFNLDPAPINLQFDTACAKDTDGDGIVDADDQFPTDAAASLDYDGDGEADDWNLGYGAEDSTTGLVLDNDDDNDGVDDVSDTFPNDRSESSDRDGDGTGDNSDAYPDDPNEQFYSIEEALAQILDGELKRCIEGQVSGLERAGQLKEVSCNSAQSLEGIQAFNQLTRFNIGNTSFANLEPLASLTQLENLRLAWGSGQISDVAPLRGLKRLHTLNLEGQSIADIGALSGLSNLESLSLRYNQIEDVSAISNLGNIRYLDLDDNQLKLVPDISGLSSLEELRLSQNLITEVADLNSSSLRHLSLENNSIRTATIANIDQLWYLNLSRNPLQSLTFADSQAIGHLNLSQAGFSDFASLLNTNDTLQYLDANQNGITSIEVLSSFTRLNGLYLEDNEIVSIGAAFDAMTGTHIQMRGNPLLCTEVERLDELPVNVYFEGQCATDSDGDGSVDGRDAFPDDPAASLDTDGDGAPDDWNEGFTAADSTSGLTLDNDDDADGVADDADAFPTDSTETQDSDGDGLGDNKDAFPNDPDQQYLSIENALAGLDGPNFQQCVREQTNGLTDAGDVYRLDCNGSNIESIGGISAFPNLQQLYIQDKQFCEIDSLSPLADLKELYLSYGRYCISDISALRGLRKLEVLHLNGNQLSDLSPIANHPMLRRLEVGENNLSSLASLGRLETLTWLRAPGNELSIPDLSGFPRLEWLKLDTNGIADLTSIVPTISTSLEHISLDNNPIPDLSSLTRFKLLRGIEAHDISLKTLKLFDMPSLDWVSVYNNQVNRIEIENVPALFTLNLGNNNLEDVSSLADFMAAQLNPNGWHFNISLYENGIKDISALAKIERLGHVSLQDNAIRDISPLTGKTEIWHLDLERNNISVLGDTFDAYQIGANVYLNGNTLLCSEVSNLENSTANIQWNGDCGEDEDGDGVDDANDAFPDDIAASIDGDGDALPDEWNAGFSQAESTTGLTLDNDDDNDGVADADDAFPNNPSESLDSDGDGVGDNGDAYPEDATRQSLEMEKALAEIVDDGLRACIENHSNGLAFANELRSLGCGEQIESLEGLEGFVGLQDLNFWNHNFTDIQPLTRLTELRRLEISWGQEVLSDIEPLGQLTQLRELSLRGLPISDISALANLARLEHLDLYRSRIVNFEPLQTLIKLRTLNLGDMSLTEIPDLRPLKSLENLDFSNNQSLDVVRLMERVPLNIRSLNLHRTGLKDVSVLGALKQLEYLDLSHNNIQTVELADLPELVNLVLWDNSISEFKIVSTPKLDSLYAGSNILSDLTSLANLTSLSQIWLNDNRITDITILSELGNLGRIELQDNLVEDIAPLADLTSVYELNLERNRISVIGNTFSDYNNANIYLSGNPLLCETLDNLPNLVPSSNQVQFNGTCGNDTDGDGVPDDLDAFPDDPAASIDSDGDSDPDDWNAGYSAAQSTQDLVVDTDDDNDGVVDSQDEFPLDATESSDVDGDGVGDNSDAAPNDAAVQYLALGDGLAGIADDALRNCVENQSQGFESAGDLTSLECSHRGVRSFEGLQSFPNLSDLNLDGADTQGQTLELSPLSGLGKLERLGIGWSWGNALDLSPLSGLKRLRYLHANGSRVTRIDALVGLPNLRELYIGWSQIEDFSPLSEIKGLTNLGLQSSGLRALPALGSAKTIRQLDLSENPLDDLQSLDALEALEQVNLNNTIISNLSPLSGKPFLRNIDARNARLESIDLNDLPELQQMSLSNNRISSVQFANVGELHWIDLNQNALASFEGFESLNNLHYLYLNNNQFSDVSTVKTVIAQTRLRDLDLQSNDITRVGDAFDGMSEGNLNLTGNPLLCEEYDGLRASKARGLRLTFESECASDTDGDGFVDARDAFPDDPAASKDNDLDGLPDVWNEGFSASDSTTALTEDTDDDNDGTPDAEDALPSDPNEQADSDQDGIGDNADAYPDDASRQYLELDLALAGIGDAGLLQCLEASTVGHVTAGQLTSLDCGNRSIQSLQGIGVFAELVYLNLNNNQFSDIGSLAALTNLEELSLEWGNGELEDLTPLTNLIRLKQLVIRGSRITDVSPLAGLVGLRELYVEYSAVQDVSSLANLKRLEILGLRSNRGNDQAGIADISVLTAMTQLTWLDLSDNAISDLSPVSSLVALNWIGLSNNQIESLAPLNGLPVLRQIDAQNNRLVSIDLTNVPRLDWFNLQNNAVKNLDGFSGSPSLNGLYLDNNPIENLAGLDNFSRLRHLSLNDTGVNDLSPLGLAISLGDLSLARNDIRDITPLATLTRLWYLNLRDNEISLLGDTFARYGDTNVDLEGNPVLCAELDAVLKSGSYARINFNAENCSEDADGDGVADEIDDFPNDPAAALDSDGDGKPDAWLEGKSAADSNTGLVLDDDDDNDGVADVDDAFPKDPRDSKDSDGDGLGDNSDAYPNDATRQFLDFSEAIEQVVDSRLKSCVTDRYGEVADVSAVTELDCWDNGDGRIQSLEGIQNFAALSYLRIDVSGSNLSPLSSLLDLEQLQIYSDGGSLSNTDALETLTRLSSLDIHSANLIDVSFAASLRRLEYLGLQNNRIDDLSPLASLDRLRHIEVGNNGLSDLNDLAEVESLERIVARDNRIGDVSDLRSLPSLRALHIGRNRLRDLQAIGEMKALEELSVHGNRLDYLDGIEGASRLRWLDVGENIYISDLSPLKALPNLAELRFGNNEISDLRPLAGLTSLRRLDGYSNDLTTLDGLEGMDSLREVSLRDNDISDVSALKGIPLAGLDLERNRVQKFADALEHLDPTRNEWGWVNINLNENPLICADLRRLRDKESQFGSYQLNANDEACQEDTDGDGFADSEDWAPNDASEHADTDGDGVGDNADDDADNDGTPDEEDSYPLDPARSSMSVAEAVRAISDSNLKACLLDTNVSSVSDLAALDCSGRNIQSTRGIENLIALESLNLQSNAIYRLSGIENLQKLRDFNVSINKVSDLTPVLGLGALERLSVAKNSFTELPDLSESTALSALDISRNPGLDLTNLVTSASLRELKMSNARLVDLSDIIALSDLTSLTLDRNDVIDIEGLAELTALTEVNLEQNAVHRLSGGLAGIQSGTIALTGNPVYCADLDAFIASKPPAVKVVFESVCLASEYGTDEDGDSIPAEVDNCPAVANSDQLDDDRDGLGNVCDNDDDNDQIEDDLDNCPFLANPNQVNTDEDGLGDVCDEDDDNDGVLDRDDAFPLDPNRTTRDAFGKQKAIIVAGGGNIETNYLWPQTQFAARTAFDAMVEQGISPQDIMVLSDDPTEGLLGAFIFEPGNVDKRANRENLEWALTTWAADPQDPASEVLVFLVDHGGPGKFLINATSVVTSKELDAWTDALQAEAGVESVAFVYDACQAGSFIDDMAPPEGKDRIFVASTTNDEPALFASRGNFSFSSIFWTNFNISGGFYPAFSAAKGAMRTFRRQKALLEANWNEVPNEKIDNAIARDFFFGRGIVKASDAPFIEAVSVDFELDGERTAVINAFNVVGATPVSRVFAVVDTPDQIEGGLDVPIVDYPEVELQDFDGDGTYEGSYDNFDIAGEYVFAFFAENEQGILSIPSEDNPNTTLVMQKSGRPAAIGFDTDLDGVIDAVDSDDDGDGVVDLEDDFPLNPYETQDFDEDGRGDNSDADDDNDGVLDPVDQFPLNSDEWLDDDGDGVANGRDAFPGDASASFDRDRDFIPDSIDTDDNNDGVADADVTNGDDAFEVDDTLADASLHRVGLEVEHTLTGGADADYARFAVVSGEDYVVSLTPNSTEQSGPDLSFSIRTRDNTLINDNAKIDSTLNGEEETYRFTAINTDIVYLVASGIATATEGYIASIESPTVGTSGAELSVALGVKNDIVIAGDRFGLSLKVTNRSKVAMQDDARLMAYPPEDAQFVDLPENCSLVSGNAQCQVSKLAAGGVAELNLQVVSTNSGLNRWFASVHELAGDGMGDDPLLANNVEEIRVYASADDDNDGLPDFYESRNNLVVGVNDRLEDPDKDGVSNFDEYLQGSDPTDTLLIEDSEASPVVDSDQDGVEDALDAFPNDRLESQDSDEDQVGDNGDNCPQTANPGQGDLDGDALGDACDTDDDGDGVDDASDAFPNDQLETEDSDGDSIGDNGDNCPLIANPGQENFDEDTLGDVCDIDDDNDGIEDVDDNAPFDPIIDSDQDGVEDALDAFPNDRLESQDSDEDQVGDNGDNCPLIENSEQEDFDGDNLGDVCDPDDDNDGINDVDDVAPLNPAIGIASLDIDRNGVVGPLTDGLLTIRHLFGFEGNALIQGAVGDGATVDLAEEISAQLDAIEPALDIDDDGSVGALSDGLLIIRHRFGFTGSALVSGALGTNANRTDPDEISDYIESLVP